MGQAFEGVDGARRGRAADAPDRGDLAAAADAFSDAVIGGYSHGLEDTLSVRYEDGIRLA